MHHKMKWTGALLLSLCVIAQTAAAATLDEVRARGVLRCGVNGSLPGLSQQDAAGRWSGLDVDLCRAVAAAVLGEADKLEYVPLTNAQRLDALRKGRIDILSRNTTWTMSRDIGNGLSFVGIGYFDGQGLMVPKEKGYRSALELNGISICVQGGTTSARNIQQYFTRNRMRFRLLLLDSPEAARNAYLEGKCDAITSDQSQLYSLRSTFATPKAHRILPEVLSKEPLGPAVRKGDDNWFDIVRWTLYTLIDAEERGVSSRNVERIRAQAKNPATRYFLDLDGESGRALKLEPRWAFRIVRQVGNYGEIFERNLGRQSPLGIKRGLNALWRDGGLMYAPPAR